MIIWFLVVAIVFGGAMWGVIAWREQSSSSPRHQVELSAEDFDRLWQQIQTLANNRQAKTAIIEADKLLDKALQAQGFRGNTLAERLAAAENKITENDDLWRAHKVRNRLVHETDYHLVGDLAEKSLKAYASSFHDLGYLDRSKL